MPVHGVGYSNLGQRRMASWPWLCSISKWPYEVVGCSESESESVGERERDPDKSQVDLDGPGLVLSGSPLPLSLSLSSLAHSVCVGP